MEHLVDEDALANSIAVAIEHGVTDLDITVQTVLGLLACCELERKAGDTVFHLTGAIVITGLTIECPADGYSSSYDSVIFVPGRTSTFQVLGSTDTDSSFGFCEVLKGLDADFSPSRKDSVWDADKLGSAKPEMTHWLCDSDTAAVDTLRDCGRFHIWPHHYSSAARTSKPDYPGRALTMRIRKLTIVFPDSSLILPKERQLRAQYVYDSVLDRYSCEQIDIISTSR